eukprot:SM000312S11988  [mRNA]  locus=s312:5753:8800:+ [translate_table: standard]
MALLRRRAAAPSGDANPPQGPRPLFEPTSSAAPLARSWRVALFGALAVAPAATLFAALDLDPGARRSIAINLAMSGAAYVSTVRMVPLVTPYVLRKNLFGYDINKRGSPGGEIKIPESLGLVVGIVYLITIILFQQFYFTETKRGLVEYYAALACICFMTFLGFIDDVLDIPWRVKLVLPSFAALPLVMAYAGHTTIVVPKPLRAWLAVEVVDLGIAYKVYMGLLVVFCTNSINILAGVNGLEVGQTVIVACAVLAHNLLQLGRYPGTSTSSDEDHQQAHLFSIYLMQPLVATSLGLLSYNWYPSAVFVGDTYTYFAGMTLAVVGILGHFSETLLLFLLPQILNFLYSCPQLFKFVPCPRHRLPKFDPCDGLLTGSNDLNLVNLFLRVLGRCSEQWLCIRLLLFQAVSCGLCFGVRHVLTGIYK